MSLSPHRMIAQTATESFESFEFSLPQTVTGLLLLAAGIVVVVGVSVRTSLRDTRFMRPPVRAALLLFRTLVLILILVIIVNPSRRAQTTRIQQSRVALMVDTSLSMAYPVEDHSPQESSDADQPGPVITRADAVRQVVFDSGLLSQLSRTHAVSVYTFGGQLKGPHAVVVEGRTEFAKPPKAAATTTSRENAVNEKWDHILQPLDSETRLGEVVHELIGQLAGRTLSGVVVVTDGQSNAGLDPKIARTRAERSETRLITVGVGSPKPQVNVWVAGMQAPADVHRGDPFDVSVVVQSNGAEPVSGITKLYQQSVDGDGSDRREVAKQRFVVGHDGLPDAVRFSREINVPGNYEFIARIIPDDESSTELTTDDNVRQCQVDVTDRRMNVLLISSGPMRDYRFLRNTLYRHTGIDSDVWLQTITDDRVGMVSQEARRLLTEFPRSAAKLAEYNVIVAFDPDWTRLSAEQRSLLNRWVHRDAGGLIVVAGETHTPDIALQADELREIAVMYPVTLNRLIAELRISQGAGEAWPVLLTPEGRASEYLRIADATGTASTDLWEMFRGVFRSYPVRGVRDGAVVLAKYGNHRAKTQEGFPPFLATQFYGAGRTFFIGSAETWRLREISPEGHQRFWTSLIREVGQASRQRSNPRGLLLLDRTSGSPGQPVSIQARLYDARMEPLSVDSVPMSIVDSDGRPVPVPDRMRTDARRAGRYSAVFRPARQGNYRISVPIPDSPDVLQANIEVMLSRLESERSEQNVDLLQQLVADTGGRYVPVSQLAENLPDLLPDRSEPIVIDEQLQSLWDQSWLMYILIALLAAEWILRRIMRLS